MNPARPEATQPHRTRRSQSQDLPPILRYGLAVVSIALALGAASLLRRLEIHNVEAPLFLFAVAISAWYGRVGGAVVSLVLATMVFDYFFTEPYYTLLVSVADIPYFIIFATFATLVSWFSAVRRRIEAELRQARDHLEVEVAERTQQASLLNLTHDSIFVRDMDFVITYWNRGAQELYGWAPEQAIGKYSHELLRTVFPIPLEDLRTES
jgi:K+-sensing histidine kinase KdpD